MNSYPTDPARLTRYLLGELPLEESAQFEQDCLDDDGLFEQLEAMEAELTDDWVKGVLHGNRREKFEKRLLGVPGAKANVELSKLITRPGASRRPLLARLKSWIQDATPPMRLLGVSALAATLVLAISIGWVSSKRWSSHSSQLVAVKSEPPAKMQPTPGDVDSGSLKPRPAAQKSTSPVVKTPLIATFTLIAGSVRGEGGANEIKIPRGAKAVRFRIELPSNEYQTYDASLNKVEGERIFLQNNVKAQASKSGHALFIDLPPAILPAGTSVLTLTGMSKNGALQLLDKYVIRVRER